METFTVRHECGHKARHRWAAGENGAVKRSARMFDEASHECAECADKAHAEELAELPARDRLRIVRAE